MFGVSFLESILSYHTDHSKSQAEGNGLKGAEQGAEAYFTITTRDSEGKPFYRHNQISNMERKSKNYGP